MPVLASGDNLAAQHVHCVADERELDKVVNSAVCRKRGAHIHLEHAYV